jgi:hypothetical protein
VSGLYCVDIPLVLASNIRLEFWEQSLSMRKLQKIVKSQAGDTCRSGLKHNFYAFRTISSSC